MATRNRALSSFRGPSSLSTASANLSPAARRSALSRSAAAAIELLGTAFGGIVVSDCFSAHNNLPTQQRQLCWAHVIRDLTAISERPGATAELGMELLDLQQQLFAPMVPLQKRHDRLI
jgi:hypothetical protein